MRTKFIALGLLVAGAVAASGQAQRPPATLDDLLNETEAFAPIFVRRRARARRCSC